MYQLSQDLPQLQQRINTFLAQQLDVDSSPSPLAEAMRYGVLLGGKRIRPFLVYATGRMLGADLNQLDYAAASVEAVHAYSLIHDDLPAMDDDHYVVDNQLAILLLITPLRF